MNVTNLDINKLIPYDHNPRKNDKAVNAVANSIKEFGFKVPIVIDKDGIIVCGHTRFKAAQKLGLETVPCVIADDLTDKQVKAFRLADNKTAELAEWDFNLLDIELDNIDDIDMSAFGFELRDEFCISDKEKNDEIFYFSPEEIQKDISDSFVKYNTVDDYVTNIMNCAKAKHEFNRLCQGYNAGYNISLLFNPHRLDCETKKSKSIFYAINNSDKYKKQFARYLYSVQKKVVVPTEFYKYIGIGHAGYQYVNEFPPYLARDIYKKYCKDGFKILNPCGGWGGRLIGLASCLFHDIEYFEFEPSKKTFEGLTKIKRFLSLDESFKQFCLPFEDAKLKENHFNFCFTSPPYFDTEHYADEDTQSFVRYKSYDEWKEKFLFVMIDKILYTLKPNGECILNVGNVRYPLDDDIKEHLTKQNVFCTRVNLGSIGGNGIGSRTDKNKNEYGQKGEPFLYFKKN